MTPGMTSTEQLPNYFLADLPEPGGLTDQVVREACESLRRNRAQFLVTRPARSMIKTLAGLAENWLDQPGRTLATRVQLSGPQIVFDQTTEKITVPGKGAMLVQDERRMQRAENPQDT